MKSTAIPARADHPPLLKVLVARADSDDRVVGSDHRADHPVRLRRVRELHVDAATAEFHDRSSEVELSGAHDLEHAPQLLVELPRPRRQGVGNVRQRHSGSDATDACEQSATTRVRDDANAGQATRPRPSAFAALSPAHPNPPETHPHD